MTLVFLLKISALTVTVLTVSGIFGGFGQKSKNQNAQKCPINDFSGWGAVLTFPENTPIPAQKRKRSNAILTNHPEKPDLIFPWNRVFGAKIRVLGGAGHV